MEKFPDIRIYFSPNLTQIVVLWIFKFYKLIKSLTIKFPYWNAIMI